MSPAVAGAKERELLLTRAPPQFAESEKHVLYFNMARDTDDALVLEVSDTAARSLR